MKVIEIKSGEKILFSCESKFRLHHLQWGSKFHVTEKCFLQIFLEEELIHQFAVENEPEQHGISCTRLYNSPICQRKINGSKYYFLLTSVSGKLILADLFITEVERGKFSSEKLPELKTTQ